MENFIEVNIITNDACIAELHRTISCLTEQTDLTRLNIHLRFTTPAKVTIPKTELNILEKHNIPVITKSSNARYYLEINSGEVFSKNFLYKGIHFLQKNPTCVAVYPECTFKRILNTNTLNVAYNYDLPINSTYCQLQDRQKIKSFDQSYSHITDVIKDTCIVLNPTKNHDSYATSNAKPFIGSIFAPSKFKKDSTIPEDLSTKVKKQVKTTIKNRLKRLLKKTIIIKRLARLTIRILRKIKTIIFRQKAFVPVSAKLTNNLSKELDALSNLNYCLKGHGKMFIQDVTGPSLVDPKFSFKYYSDTVKLLKNDRYDYVMVLPWIIHGGIDLFAINYLRTIASLHPDFHILVILTNNEYQSLSRETLGFPDSIEIINLSEIITSPYDFHRYSVDILYSLLTNFSPKYLHVISTQTGYDCVIKYNDELHAKTNLIFSSYNFIIDDTGKYLGYHAQELPKAYRPEDIVTTDNILAKKTLVEHYGFPEQNILVHNQLFNIKNLPEVKPTSSDGINILWTSHVRPEKNPNILPKIASLLQKDHINIDCYGIFNPNSWENGKNPLETNLGNLHYCGEYQNFFNDLDLQKYDLFLYTSHTDGTPNAILEAALSGLPIVTSDIGGIADVVGDCAYLVKDTHSAQEFITGVRSVLLDRDNSLAKAKKLQRELQRKHSQANFNKQVNEMLEKGSKK